MKRPPLRLSPQERARILDEAIERARAVKCRREGCNHLPIKKWDGSCDFCSERCERDYQRSTGGMKPHG